MEKRDNDNRITALEVAFRGVPESIKALQDQASSVVARVLSLEKVVGPIRKVVFGTIGFVLVAVLVKVLATAAGLDVGGSGPSQIHLIGK